MSQLIVIQGKNQGKRYDINKFPVVFGRDSSVSDVSLDDVEVSRRHFQIKKRGKIIVVHDLNSKNGTYLNGDLVINSVIKNGDKLIVGSTELKFVASEANVQFSEKLLDFGMTIDDEISISKKITLDARSNETIITPMRLEKMTQFEQNVKDSKILRKIYECQSNILVLNSIKEAALSLLKYLSLIYPSIDRAALFTWSESDSFLSPIAKINHKQKINFQLNKKALESVIDRRVGLVIPKNTQDRAQSNSTRIVLPMEYHEHLLAVIHLEVDDLPTVSLQNIEYLQGLIFRVAPIFDSFILRREIDQWLVGSMQTLLAAIEAKDTYTHGHSERVCRYSSAMADELRLDRTTKKLLIASSLVHDIGKIGIPDSILKKASLLSSDEYEEMKLHPTIGADIISHMPNCRRFMSGVKYHHEKWDGTGYPDGLVGDEIPFFARIVAIADVYDAMVSGRSYSGFLDQNDAAEKLMSEADLFDKDILKAFEAAHNNGTLTLKTSTKSNNPEKDLGHKLPPTPDTKKAN